MASPPATIPVVVRISTANPSCKIETETFTFSTNNWNKLQTVRVTFENNQKYLAKDSILYTCKLLHTFVSNDKIYNLVTEEILRLKITSAGCGVGEYLGPYPRADNGTECVCNNLYYLPPKSFCRLCPADISVCEERGLKAPLVAPNFWRSNPISPDIDKYQFYPCPFPGACVGGNAIVGRCREGHNDYGPLCATCDESYIQDTSCEPCPQETAAENFSPLTFALFTLLFALLLFA